MIIFQQRQIPILHYAHRNRRRSPHAQIPTCEDLKIHCVEVSHMTLADKMNGPVRMVWIVLLSLSQ